MDPAVLEAIVPELEEALAGQRVEEISQLDSHRFLVRFADPPFPRLHIGIHPRLSTIHLARRVTVPREPTALAVTLTRTLEGARVSCIGRPPCERIVRIRFDTGHVLAVELMGKASNLLLLDPEDRILAFARGHGGAFRRPGAGEAYVPPPAHAGTCSLDTISEDTLAGLLDSAAGDDTARRLVSSVAGLGLHLAREIARHAAAPEAAWGALDRSRRRLREGPHDPCLHAPRPPDGIPETLSLGPRDLFAFPWPLEGALADGLVSVPHGSLNEAVEAETNLLLRHHACVSVRESLAGVLRQEARRARHLMSKLRVELEESERGKDRDRRRGELILAGLHRAERRGSEVIVPDPWNVPQTGDGNDDGEPKVAVPIDPRLDLPANADRYFKSARRAGRRGELIPARLLALEDRLARVDAAIDRCGRAASHDELLEIERRLQDGGVVRAYRRKERPDVARRAEYVPVREYTTSDGLTVLVGRSSADNDQVTFRIGAPQDLWLHAAGRPGAHVLVRNPGRLASIPDRSVLEAAAIAAWFSKGREEKHLDVHVAWRRHVRKGKGMSPGMVMLKRFRTVRVRPGLPAGGAGKHEPPVGQR